MNSITSLQSQNNEAIQRAEDLRSALSSNKSVPADLTQKVGSTNSDSVNLSPAARELFQSGRIALNEKAGNITGDQATDLYAQLAATKQQIATDKAANGGTLSAIDAESIKQTQNQTSGQIYSNSHNGVAPPSTAPPISPYEARNVFQFARVELNEEAGNLTSDQASSLNSRISSVQKQIVDDQTANKGPLTLSQRADIKNLQNQLSLDIKANHA